MPITVEDLLARMQNKGMRCVAGFNGLSNEVSSFSIVDTPDIAQWMKGGEFVTSTGYVTNENPRLRKNLVRELAEKGCAGLGLKTSHYHKHAPQEFIDQGNEYDFPIIELDYNLRFSDISFLIHQSNFQHEMDISDKINLVYRKIVKIILSHSNAEDVLYSICSTIPNPIILLDKEFKLISYENPSANKVDLSQYLMLEKEQPVLPDNILKAVSHHYEDTHFRSHNITFINGDTGIDFIFIPIELEGINWGFLLIPETIEALSVEHYEILNSLRSAVGIYFLKNKYTPSALSNKNNDSFLNQVLLNNCNTSDNIRYYAELYDFDHLKKRICVNIHVNRYHDLPYEKRKSLYELIHYSFNTLADKYDIGHFHVYFEENFTAFFFFSKSTTIRKTKELSRDIATELCDKMIQHNVQMKIGVSDISLEVDQIPNTFKQAIDMIALGERVAPQQQIYAYEEFQIYYTLSSTMCEEELRALANTVWELYLEDQENGTSYIETLEVFINNKFNLTKAASDIHLHRNSLVYRLNKIRDILSMDLDEQENLFKIQLSLNALHLYTSRTKRKPPP